MSWDQMFSLTNGWALVSWLVLALAPRRPIVMTGILFLGCGLLCLTYAIMLGAVMSGSVDVGGPTAPLDFSSITGVQALFATRGGTVIGWTHYLAFDLFTGLWIARDADTKRVHRLLQIPILALTLMFGPVGLLTWLIVREPRVRALQSRSTEQK